MAASPNEVASSNCSDDPNHPAGWRNPSPWPPFTSSRGAHRFGAGTAWVSSAPSPRLPAKTATVPECRNSRSCPAQSSTVHKQVSVFFFLCYLWFCWPFRRICRCPTNRNRVYIYWLRNKSRPLKSMPSSKLVLSARALNVSVCRPSWAYVTMPAWQAPTWLLASTSRQAQPSWEARANIATGCVAPRPTARSSGSGRAHGCVMDELFADRFQVDNPRFCARF